MALAIIYTRASIGVHAPLVTIEIHISNGLPGFTLVGLPEIGVKEAKDRVRSALINSGFTFPAKRITVNLAPADLPKEGARYDLPIAIAILAASQQIDSEQISQYEFIGELALSGQIKGIKGAIAAAQATIKDKRTLILSIENQEEIALLQHQCLLPVSTLNDIHLHLSGQKTLSPIKHTDLPQPNQNYDIDLDDIIGQDQGKRALEIAAAGGHNLLLMGPPGSGKTMLAMRLMTLLPDMSLQEALESATINSLRTDHQLNLSTLLKRPFRTPHHSASIAALVGGGSTPYPGEISLAHNGVLFLDELPEFDKKVLDSLRQPLEAGEITISRANKKVIFPAKFQLIAAMNPSPTGHYQGIHNRVSPQQVMRYLNKLSGPFLDRFDLSLEIPTLPKGAYHKHQTKRIKSQAVKQKVRQAREKQLTRSGKINSQLTNKELEQYCHLTDENTLFLENAIHKLHLSTRAYHRILKVSRTIADLDNIDQISKTQLAEALNYRAMDITLLNLHKLLSTF